MGSGRGNFGNGVSFPTTRFFFDLLAFKLLSKSHGRGRYLLPSSSPFESRQRGEKSFLILSPTAFSFLPLFSILPRFTSLLWNNRKDGGEEKNFVSTAEASEGGGGREKNFIRSSCLLSFLKLAKSLRGGSGESEKISSQTASWWQKGNAGA